MFCHFGLSIVGSWVVLDYGFLLGKMSCMGHIYSMSSMWVKM